VFGDGMHQFSPADFEVVARRFAELTFPLTAGWSNLLGSEVLINVSEVTPGPDPTSETLDPSSSATLLDNVAGAGSYRVIATFGPDLDAIAVVVPTALGLTVVDRLLGGTGRTIDNRRLTDIDRDLLSTVLEPTFGAIGELRPSGQGHLPIGRMTETIESELNDRLAAGSTVTITVVIGDERLPLHIVLGPAATRELAGVRSQSTHTTPLSKSESELKMQSALASVSVEVVVAFEPIKLPSHRVLALDVGDIISLRMTPDSALPLFVDERRLAEVRPARSGTQVACQVVSTFRDGTPDSSATPDSHTFGGSL